MADPLRIHVYRTVRLAAEEAHPQLESVAVPNEVRPDRVVFRCEGDLPDPAGGIGDVETRVPSRRAAHVEEEGRIAVQREVAGVGADHELADRRGGSGFVDPDVRLVVPRDSDRDDAG